MKTRFRESLIEHMARTGTTAAGLARATGVSKAQIDKLVQRKVEVTNVADAIRIATYFNMSVEEFSGLSVNGQRIAALAEKLHPDEISLLEAQIEGILARRRL